MTTVSCNGCLHPISIEVNQHEVTCPLCHGVNQIEMQQGQLKTKLVLKSESINMGSAKKLFRISDNATNLIDAIQTLRIATLTEAINEGILLYLNNLSDKEKQRIAKYLDFKNK